VRVPASDLSAQLHRIFTTWGMTPEHASITCARMHAADIRGIDSHGASMMSLYAQQRAEGRLNFRPEIRVLRESPVTALIDADHSLGHVPSSQAMHLAIAKAKQSGLAAVAVKNSNHYGAAGAYALMAAEQGLIGMAFTSVWHPLVVPTFAAEPMFGTNPIALAAPGKKHPMFYLDMDTSTVAAGKLKVASLNGKSVPEGWAVTSTGESITDPDQALLDVRLTPLGATRVMGSHKGYGLMAMVEILCSMVPGAWFAPTRAARERGGAHYNIGHFFIAIDPDAFRDEGEFEDDLDDMIDALHAARPVDALQPVLVAGDPEQAAMDDRILNGIPVPDKLLAQLESIALGCGAPWLLGER
jgi:LDH2 family malate/lactate/ureidoglycolate dehydrogenase